MLQQWERCNTVVPSWIINSVSKELFGGIIYSLSAYPVRQELKERLDKVHGSRIFSIQREIGSLTQGSSITSYFTKLKL